MTNSIDTESKKILDDFNLLDSWEDRYQQIISLGKSLEKFPETERKDKNLVKGCQSRVWIYIEQKDNLVKIFGDSDAFITKGLIAILIKIYDNASAIDIAKHKTDIFLKSLKLEGHLSPTRSNGLYEMVNKIKILSKKCAENTR